MRQLPVDRFGSEARMQANGRVTYDLGIYRVKTPAASRAPWDYYEKIATVPAADAFRSAAESGCAAAGETKTQ
jgi:branched-chain amino acid transport system substrate-binding protein